MKAQLTIQIDIDDDFIAEKRGEGYSDKQILDEVRTYGLEVKGIRDFTIQDASFIYDKVAH